MIKRILALIVAFAVLALFFPIIHSQDVTITGIETDSPARYYQRLKNLRRNDPDNFELTYQIANYYYSLGMEDQAIHEYRRVLEMQPAHSYARYYLSRLLISKGYFEDAFWLVRELITRHPSNPSFYQYAGEILQKMDQHIAAREYFDRYNELMFAKRGLTEGITIRSRPTNRGQWRGLFYR